MVQLYDDERLDYLYAKDDMQIIQSSSVFSFSLDAVLLARFAYIPIRGGEILDLCTGNGVIPLLLSRRTNANITGVEIQGRLADMAHRSVQLNELEKKISIIHGDLNDMQPVLGHSKYDVITCNPPYFKSPGVSEHNDNLSLTIARHEIYCTLEDVIRACKFHVKPGGKVAIIHRPGRLVDLIDLLRSYRLEPKRIQFIYPKKGKDANMLLIEAVRDGSPDVKLLPPLTIYNEDNTYTKKARDLIHGRP